MPTHSNRGRSTKRLKAERVVAMTTSSMYQERINKGQTSLNGKNLTVQSRPPSEVRIIEIRRASPALTLLPGGRDEMGRVAMACSPPLDQVRSSSSSSPTDCTKQSNDSTSFTNLPYSSRSNQVWVRDMNRRGSPISTSARTLSPVGWICMYSSERPSS